MNLYSAMRRSSCLVTDYTSEISVCKRMLESFTEHERSPIPTGTRRRSAEGGAKPVRTPLLKNVRRRRPTPMKIMVPSRVDASRTHALWIYLSEAFVYI